MEQVDVGTQSVKVLVYSLRTHGVVGRGQREYGLECTRPGMAEQAPSVWEEGLQAALRDALQCHDASEVRAVAVSGQQHGLVAMDADGAVSGLTPASRHGTNREGTEYPTSRWRVPLALPHLHLWAGGTCCLCSLVRCMRDVKDKYTPLVCTFFRPSCVQKTRLTNESEVSSPSNRRISAMCGWWCWAS